jgi:hypothetical protein
VKALSVGHIVAGIWAAMNLGLALGIFAFGRGTFETWIHIFSAMLVAAFAGAVLLAKRGGRDRPQHRQPRRATAATLGAIGLTLGVSGFVYGYWLGVLGLYPIGLALFLLRGERLPPGAEPSPAALDATSPAPGPPRYGYTGSSPGPSAPVPPGHPARAAPDPGEHPRSKVATAAVVVAAARAAASLARRRRRP